MTALEQYIRLEAPGRWREAADGDWREVLVSFGNATLVLSDFNEAPLTHWSLAATRKAREDQDGAHYRPDMESEEDLIIADPAMNEAIAEVTARARAAGRPGRGGKRRLGRFLVAGLLLLILAVGALKGPDALRARALALVPQERARLIDEDMFRQLSPALCRDDLGAAALRRLADGVAPGMALAVANWQEPPIARLPGGGLVLSRAVVEGAVNPRELAGWIALGAGMSRAESPLGVWIGAMSLGDVARFLASARITGGDIAMMTTQLRQTAITPSAQSLDAAVARLAEAGLDAGDFLSAARATYPGLPAVSAPAPPPPRTLLRDGDWVAVQGICAG